MRTFVTTLVVLAIAVFAVAAAGDSRNEAATPLPARVPVDVELTTLTGAPRTEVVTLVVSLYASKDSADPLWSEEQTVKANEAGKLTVLAGATSDNGIPQALFASTDARWIGIAVKGELEQPRIMMVSVPYAVRARDAETIGGRPATDFVRVEELKDTVRKVLVEQQHEIPQQAVRPVGPVGAAPEFAPRPHVTVISAAGQFNHQATTGFTTGVFGSAASTSLGSPSSGVSGVLGQVTTTAAGIYSAGVRGLNFGTGGNGVGVIGVHNGGGFGVFGTAATGIGVVASTDAAVGTSLLIDNGAMRVSGSVRTAFVLTGVPVDFLPTGGSAMQNTIPIDSPLSNGDPNALVFVTPLGRRTALPLIDQAYSADDQTPNIFVAYVPEIGKWGIFHTDFSDMVAGAQYHVLIIKS